MDRIAGVHLNSVILRGTIIIVSPLLNSSPSIGIFHYQRRIHFSLEEVGGKGPDGRCRKIKDS